MAGEEVRSLTPIQAWELIEGDPRIQLIDVRSNMEYLFVGHPKGSIHISWIDQPDWTINPNFTFEVSKALLDRGTAVDNIGNGDHVPIILICRSGTRSLEAGKALLKKGFSVVYSVQGGFEGELDETHRRSTINGWRFDGLPWEQC